MAKRFDGAWIKDSEIDPRGITVLDTLDEMETFTTSVSTCWACVKTLMQKEKEELIQMLINFHSFAQPKEVIKKRTIHKKKEKGGEDEG
jgi:uncharacterized protein with PIN domain